MHINHVFLTVFADDHARLLDWWTSAMGRSFDRIPVPNCREWDLTSAVIFQVIDEKRATKVDVSLHVDNLDKELQRLKAAGIDMGEPVRVQGFDALLWAGARDPEGNNFNLLSGS